MSIPDIKIETQEYIAEQQLQWLKERGLSFADMHEDEDGEFIFSEEENGTAGEDGYSVETVRVYLPDFTQEL